ncbi:embigin-like [Gadus chalcogrammus]|uniref:embigin-like n=1 Tax=Gadus chalcogrammus TaxID=1042646 RepID=UPI0024C49B58|nr:embigin-like [Gadus chalcogrammus]
MLHSGVKLCARLLLLSLSWGGTHSTGGPGSTLPPVVSGPPLSSDVRSVVFKGESQVEEVQVVRPLTLALECTWTGSQDRPHNISGFWRKDGSELADSRRPVLLENQQYNLRRTFSITDEEGLGNYSCVFDNQAEVDFILAAPRVGEVRDKPIVSYVGDSVVLQCKMEDTKPQPNSWTWYRANGTDKELLDPEPDSPQYQIHNQEGKTKLTVRNLTEADSGAYYCGAVYDISVTLSRVDLRVITFLEPLKPFLVIVGEVLVLVSLILLYERTKAHGPQPDNTLSDDQAHKLTPDDAGGEVTDSSTRQRKV